MQKILAEMIAKDFSIARDKIISVTKVSPSGNLQEAKVYISVLPDQEQKNIVAGLNRNIIFFQKNLDKKLKMRPVPKIIFVSDTNPAQAQQVETILEKLKENKNG